MKRFVFILLLLTQITAVAAELPTAADDTNDVVDSPATQDPMLYGGKDLNEILVKPLSPQLQDTQGELHRV